MGLAGTIAGRSLLGRPGRTAFSILGVALGIATVVCVFTVDHVSVLSRAIALDPGWGADLEVRPSGTVADPREELMHLEGVAGVAAFFQNNVRVRPVEPRPGTDDTYELVHLVALEAADAPSLGVYHVQAGTGLDPSDATGVLIGGGLAEAYGLGLGDRILLAAPPRSARRACVDGEMQGEDAGGAIDAQQVFTVRGVLAYEGLGRRGKGHVVVIDYAPGRRLFRDVFVESQFWVKRDESVDVEELEATLGQGFSFERNESRAAGQMADERAFRNGVRVAGLFALLLGLFVIFHTLSMALLERVREVGTLHSLGTTPAQLARVFFVEALVIATSAGVLGVCGGLVLARLMLWKGISTLGVTGRPVGPFEVPWRTVLALTCLGVGIALVGSVYPILRARGTNVVAILRGEDLGQGRRASRAFHLLGSLLLLAVVPAVFFAVAPVVGASDPALVRTILIGLVVLGFVIGAPLLWPALLGTISARLVGLVERRFPLPAKLARGALQQNPSRIGASIAAIALVTSAFVALEGMTRSLKGEIEVWADRALSDKVWIEYLPDVPFDELRRSLHELPEVVGVEPGDVRAHVSFLMLGVEPDELAGYGPAADDPEVLAALRDEQAIVVSERLAQQRGVTVGDELLVNTSGHDVQRFEIVAISDAYGYFIHPDERAYGVTSTRHLERYFCLDTSTTTTVGVRLEPGTDPGKVAAWLAPRYPGARALGGAWVRRLHLTDLSRDFILFDIILLLTAALAGLGVLNGQLLSALERRKELGVLRALGMTQGQVVGAVLLESIVIGLLGGVLGIAVGSALVPLVVSALQVLSGLELPLRGAGAHAGLFLLGAVVLAVLAGIYPIWRMNRMDAVRAVRTG